MTNETERIIDGFCKGLPRDLREAYRKTYMAHHETIKHLIEPDGAAAILEKLPVSYPPEKVGEFNHQFGVWAQCGNFYRFQNRHFEALSLYSNLYEQILKAQECAGQRYHKGLPLVWIRECFWNLGYLVHAKRYMMLTLCEDAINDKGLINPSAGVYFRMVWQHGMGDAEVRKYFADAYSCYENEPEESRFPEHVLKKLDKTWMTEFPANAELMLYTTNTIYIRHLMSALGESRGIALEELAEYLLSCMPGCKAFRRQRTPSTDYDVICSVEGLGIDFRSELGRYIVCECKDWDKAADFTTFAKLCRVLDSTKAKFGILFSKKGISGEGETRYAEREQLKVFQDRGIVIVVIDEDDLEQIAEGSNFIPILKRKYEEIRLDLVRSP